MNAVLERIESLSRDLIVEKDFLPLEQALPASGYASGLFDACVARSGRERIDVLAFLAWRGQDPAELRGRADSLRQALRESEGQVSPRLVATLFVVDSSGADLEGILGAMQGIREGHFLEKILLTRAAASCSGELSYRGGVKPPVSLDWLEEHLAMAGGHDAEEARRALHARSSDESRARRLVGKGDTWATWILIALNSVAFMVQHLFTGELARRLGTEGLMAGQHWAMAEHILGANQGSLVFGQHQIWRLFTSMFLHDSVPHLAFNMVSLFSLGTLLERLSGPLRFALLYLLSGLLGSLLSALNPADLPSLGASGAIFGLAGALLALKWRRPKDFPQGLAGRIFGSLLRPVVITFALGISLSYLEGPIRFDNWAHFGGLASGFLMVLLRPNLLNRPGRARKR